MPTFIKLAVSRPPHIFDFRVSPQPSQARASSAFVSTNILLHLPAGFVSDSRIP